MEGRRGFREALFLLSATADWSEYRPNLLKAVLDLTAENPKSPKPHERDLAEEVIDAIKDILPHAKQGDQLARYQHQEVLQATERVRARVLGVDWAPDVAKQILRELAEYSSEEAIAFDDALKDKDPRPVVVGLLGDSPRWVQDGSGLLWEGLAATAEGAGEWDLARDAWLEAFERAGSNRTRTLVKASQAEYILERPDEGEELLERAIKLEPEHPLVLLASPCPACIPLSCFVKRSSPPIRRGSWI